MKNIIGFFVGLLLSAVSYGQQAFPLYDNIPNSIPGPDNEVSEITNGMERISRVSIPTLSIFLPPVPGKKPAVIICPGGGYARLSVTKEGYDVAKVFNEWGVSAFVLKYRLPNDTLMNDKSIGPLQDARRAIQMLREHAEEWNVDTSRIGLMGFSAGGHLAACGATDFYLDAAPADKSIFIRPAFSILIYPVISFDTTIAHMGSRNRLIGNNPSKETVEYWSADLKVSSKTPPTFLVATADDKTVPVANSINYYNALLKNKVPAEMHIYQAGGHGFGMNNSTTTEKWMDRLKAWMQGNKLL